MKETELSSQAAKIFSAAADYIRRYGWQKRGMSSNRNPRCSMGALASAYPVQKWDKKMASLMYKALYKELNGLTLTQFNYKFNDGEKVALLYERVARTISLAGKNTTPGL